MEKETEKKIGQLQLMEQSIQSVLMQRQQLQAQLIEIESALKEIQATDNAYKILGNIMVKTDRNALENELKTKKDIIELKSKTLEKQEKSIRDKSKSLQEEVMKKLKPESD
jgi:prefoldin beta subunit